MSLINKGQPKIVDVEFVVLGEPRWKQYWRRWQPRIVLAVQFAVAFAVTCAISLLSKFLNGR